MSFNLAEFFGKILHVVQGVDKIAHPIVADIAAVPSPIQGFAAGLLSIMGLMENLLPNAGQGATRKTAVVAVMNATHPNVDTGAMSAIIDKMVAAGNKAQAAKVAAQQAEADFMAVLAEVKAMGGQG